MFLAPLAAAAAPYAAALTGVGAVASTVGVFQSMQASATAAEYNADIADRDAAVARQNSVAALDQSRIAAEDKRRENRRALGAVRAAYGTSGVELAGSPLDVLTDSATEMELDARRVEYEGLIRGREGALQMLGFSESAALSRMEADSTNSAMLPAVAGTALSGAGTALSRMG